MKKFTQEQIKFIKENINNDSFQLSLSKDKYKIDRVEDCINQIKARQKAKKKLPNFYDNFELIFPSPLSIEQTSSELTAKYKASLLKKGKEFIDLSGGFGIDFYYISELFENCRFLEPNKDLLEIVEHNFRILELKNIDYINVKADNYLNNIKKLQFDLIYIDPSRRNENKKKLVLLEHCSPNIVEIWDNLLKYSKKLMVKLSPMTDIAYILNKLSNINEIHIVSHKNECKELILISDKNLTGLKYVTALIGKDIIYEIEENQLSNYCNLSSEIKKYIYIPDVAITKANAQDLIAYNFNLFKLENNVTAYTSDKIIEEYPGRIFKFNSFHISNDKKYIRKLKDKKFNILRRNINLSTEQLKKKYKIKDGGDNYLLFYNKNIITMEALKLYA